ncbi:DMT family transporter [bacterium]|nr:DMT family transporter [bacterium]
MLTAYSMLLAVTVIWGFTFPLIQNSLEFVSPLVFLALRFSLAGLLFPLIVWPRAQKLTKQRLRRGIVLGLLLCSGYIFQTIGLQYTSSARAGFITALYVPLTPIAAWLFFRAHIRPRMWLAVTLASVGIGILALPETLDESGNLLSQLSLNFGDQLTLVCAACYALHIVLINRWSHPEDELPLTWVQLSVAGILCALAIPFESAHFEYTHYVGFTIVFTSLFASVLAIWAMMRYQPRLPVSGAAVIYATEPVMAGLAAWIIQNHIPPFFTILGAGFILAAMLIASTIRETEIASN